MLSRKTFFIREHVGLLKLADTYDILDPETQAQLGVAKEKPGTLIHVLRFLINKRLLPTKVFVYEGAKSGEEGTLRFSIERGLTFLRSKVLVCDAGGAVVGWFKSKMFSLGGAFYVFDARGNQVAFVKGDWKGWNFRFLDQAQNEIGTITKKWAGIGKELFTSADNYMLSLSPDTASEHAMLLLAAGLAVDVVYKEK